MVEGVFIELSYIVMVTAVLAVVAKFFKQPLIIAYILAGVVVSPHVLDLVKSHDAIATFSQLGIAFLLFMVGLDLSPKVVKQVGKVSLITGVGQVFFTSSIGFFIAKFFNFTTIESLYIAVALTFSSTIVIMKLLSDKKDLDSLYGRISIGFLVVQDVIAMMILIVISSLAGGQGTDGLVFGAVLKGIGLITATYLIGKHIIPAVTKKLASNLELFFLSSISWCFALSTISYLLGFSIEIGALLAGVSLSLSPYRQHIVSRVKPLRDFFILMFFIFLGSQMQFTNIGAYILPIIVFSLFVLIGNPLIVMGLMGAMKYTKRTGFLAGLTVAQISEFSLLLIALGVKTGHLSADILSFATIVGLLTIGGSTYFIIYGKKLYNLFAPYLKVFERRGQKVDEHGFDNKKAYEVLVVGYEHMGKNLVKKIQKLKKSLVVIDYNPEIISKLLEKKIDCRFADVEDPGVFADLNLSKTQMVISSIKSTEINLQLIAKVRQFNRKCIIIVLSENRDPCLDLYSHGATYVITPDFLESDHTFSLIEKHGFDPKRFLGERLRHLKKLQIQA